MKWCLFGNAKVGCWALMKALTALAAILLVSCAGNGPGRSGANDRFQDIAILQKFDLWDYNGDGYLSEKEVTDGVKDRDSQIAEPPVEIIKHFDRNGDGRISLAEAEGRLG